MSTGMSPHQHSGGSPYPPHSRVEPVAMDPHRAMGGLDPHRAMGGLDPHRAMGGLDPHRAMGGLDPHRAMGGLDPHRAMGGLPVDPRFPPVSGQQVGPPPTVRQIPVSVPSPPRLSRPPEAGSTNWVAPGDVVNTNAPEVACPLCGRNDFATVTDLEIHCARCTGPS